jgi:hypothetical protein
MNGGSMTTFSRISMAAVAALVVGMGSAKAADLGGNCCADLEERIAELEATTARKGTRKVSLTISGQISQQLMFWDDGVRNDMYISGPTQSNSRWRFTGQAKISPEVSAGFLYEFEAFGSQSSAQNQVNGNGIPGLPPSPGGPAGVAPTGDDAGASHTSLREALAWIEHSRLGRITIGHGSTAANNAILVDLSGKGMAASNDVRLHSSGFRLNSRTLAAINPASGGYLSSGTWGAFFQGSSGDWLNERNEHIQYRTPTLAGFSLGASFGEDNYWDVESRYSGEFNGVRIASRLGYSVRSEYNTTAGAMTCSGQCEKHLEQLAGSLSVRHMPTGLFFTGAAGWREMHRQDGVGFRFANDDGDVTIQLPNRQDFKSSFFYLSGGVARNMTGLGDTVFYGEYSEWKGNAQDTNLTAQLGGLGPFDSIQLSAFGGPNDKLTHWGIGIVQHVDAAAMEFWLAYKNYAIRGPMHDIAQFEDLHLLTVGTRIRF